LLRKFAYIAEHSTPSWCTFALPWLFTGTILASWIFHALVAVWTGPTWLAPAVIGSVAPTVVSVTTFPTDGLRAKAPRPARLAVALHGLVTIAVLGVAAWQRDADITVLAYPPRVANAFSWH